MTFQQRLLKHIHIFNKKYPLVNIFLALLAILLFSIVIYFGYQWYSINRDRQAQRVFAEVLDQYEHAVAQDKLENLGQLAKDFHKGYEDHKSSSLAPYFLAFESQIYQTQGAKDEALALMKQSLTEMQKENPLYYLYAIKLALLKLDSSIEHQDGVSDLVAISEQLKNPHRDMALYWLGYDFYAAGNSAQAEEYWSKLIREFGSNSIWSHTAQEKFQFMA